MKLLIKILFFLFAIFQTNICGAKVFVFSEVVTQIRFIENAIEDKNVITTNLRNDITITCKSESDLLDYGDWAISTKAAAARIQLGFTGYQGYLPGTWLQIYTSKPMQLI